MEVTNLDISKENKTGIMTFHLAHNYGALLQAYALKTYLKSVGKPAEIVPYISKQMSKEYDIMPHFYRPIRDNLGLIKNYFVNKAQAKPFEDFQKKHLSVDITKNLTKEELADYSQIVIGSDQVWNPDIVGDDLVYWGDFKSPNQRIVSYAGSFGLSSISDDYRARIEKLARGFDAISVREAQAGQILKESQIDSVRVCDPVFLLNKEQWSQFAGEGQESSDYIFVYALQQNDELSEEVERYSKEHNLKVYIVHPTNRNLGFKGQMLSGVSVEEFVRLIRDASIVATNSFHALSFSVIFGKEYIYRAHKKLGSRTEELIKLVEDNNDKLTGLIVESRKFISENI